MSLCIVSAIFSFISFFFWRDLAGYVVIVITTLIFFHENPIRDLICGWLSQQKGLKDDCERVVLYEDFVKEKLKNRISHSLFSSCFSSLSLSLYALFDINQRKEEISLFDIMEIEFQRVFSAKKINLKVKGIHSFSEILSIVKEIRKVVRREISFLCLSCLLSTFYCPNVRVYFLSSPSFLFTPNLSIQTQCQ